MRPGKLAAGLGAGLAGTAVVAVAGLGDAGVGIASPSPLATSSVPAAMLRTYTAAAKTCPGLPWSVLAAIGTVESANGTSPLPGVTSGANEAGAEGPMQFLPATFAAYDHPMPADPAPTPPDGATPPNPYDPVDAVYAAARMLCANGGGSPAGLAQAVFAYNHSPAYVAQVLSLSAAYSRTPPGSASPAGEAAAGYALAQVGTPYVWGGAEPGGFDCSGLVHFAYGLAGVALPRLAQAQYDAGRHLSSGEPLSEGDLVFFGEGPSAVDHVGIYVGDGRMVDAPHTGATVRVEPVAGFSPPYVGATDPTDRGAGP